MDEAPLKHVANVMKVKVGEMGALATMFYQYISKKAPQAVDLLSATKMLISACKQVYQALSKFNQEKQKQEKSKPEFIM